MSHSYKRSARISDLLIKEISEMLVRGKIKDPRVSSASITAVRVTDDMGYAKVFFTSFDERSDTQEMLEGLRNATGYIRSTLSKRLRIKKELTIYSFPINGTELGDVMHLNLAVNHMVIEPTNSW